MLASQPSINSFIHLTGECQIMIMLTPTLLQHKYADDNSSLALSNALLVLSLTYWHLDVPFICCLYKQIKVNLDVRLIKNSFNESARSGN